MQVKVGVQGAEEFGDYEEWFNYRLSRAAPETCAEFLGSFVADKTNSQFIKGGKWLVWKFEVRKLALNMKKKNHLISYSEAIYNFPRLHDGEDYLYGPCLLVHSL